MSTQVLVVICMRIFVVISFVSLIHTHFSVINQHILERLCIILR